MKIAIVSTYPPRPCGIGTFSADLRGALLLADPANEVNIVSIVSEEVRSAPAPRDRHQAGRVTSSLRNHPPEVSASLRQNVREDYAAAARMLSSDGTDVVLIEHEYGIFGGEAGEYVLTLVSELQQPVVVTLHTVLSTPSAAQTATLRRLCELATLVTVFTETARRMVVESQTVAADKVRVVRHGAPAVLVAQEVAPTADGTRVVDAWPAARHRSADAALRRRLQGRTVLSTFGLISSGKGIELALHAVAQVVRRHPEVIYLVAGQSHPEVVKHEGESYRRGLERQVAELGLQHHVLFLDRFLAIEELAALLSATDLYLTPYRSKEQIVSGALTFAVAAGCPVVSTPYFYAEDLLSSGAGVLVPFDDPDAMAAAISDLLDSPAALAAARAQSVEVGSRAVVEQCRPGDPGHPVRCGGDRPGTGADPWLRPSLRCWSDRATCWPCATTSASSSTRTAWFRAGAVATASTTRPVWFWSPSDSAAGCRPTAPEPWSARGSPCCVTPGTRQCPGCTTSWPTTGAGPTRPAVATTSAVPSGPWVR